MTIKDYRRKLNQEVAAEVARKQEPGWGAELESKGAPDVLGRAQGGAVDAMALTKIATDPVTHPDYEIRTAALGRIVSQADPANAHDEPLRRLADKDEDWHVRLAALGLLKQLSFSSPTFSEWRPAYVDALRSAVATQELRLPALSVLTAMGDRRTQEQLVEGLKAPSKALVSVADALTLLSQDSHADVRDIARDVADKPPDDRALQAALRHLAGDPSSVTRLKRVLEDTKEPVSTRKLAATSLLALGPEYLDEYLPRTEALAAAAAPSSRDPVVEHVQGLLRWRPKK